MELVHVWIDLFYDHVKLIMTLCNYPGASDQDGVHVEWKAICHFRYQKLNCYRLSVSEKPMRDETS